jgi:hypothetical protein
MLISETLVVPSNLANDPMFTSTAGALCFMVSETSKMYSQFWWPKVAQKMNTDR